MRSRAPLGMEISSCLGGSTPGVQLPSLLAMSRLVTAYCLELVNGCGWEAAAMKGIVMLLEVGIIHAT